jgi:hypothetical protein
MEHKKTAWQRLLDSDSVGSRITLAIGEFFWAIMLLWPGDTFDRPTYAYMATTMSEEFWGIVFLISGIIQLTIVLKNYINLWSWYFAGWNFCLWAYVVSSMLASVNPPPAAIGGEIALAFSAGWIWLRPIILAFRSHNK